MGPLIPALTSAYSLFQGIGQQREARRREEAARRLEAESQRMARQRYAALSEDVRALRAQGVGNADAATKSLQEQYDAGLAIALPNAARAFRTAGGRAGDSSLEDAVHGFTARETAAMTAQVLQAKQNALNDSLRLTQILQGGSESLGNALSTSAAQYRYDAQAHPGDLGPAITAMGAIDWDGIFGKRPKKKNAPYPTWKQVQPYVEAARDNGYIGVPMVGGGFYGAEEIS